MARLLTSGFEINTSASTGNEFANVAGSPTVQTTVARSGDRALQITSLTSGTRMGFIANYTDGFGDGPYFMRFAFRVDTAPSALNVVACLITGNSSGGLSTSDGHIKLGSDRTLNLYVSSTLIGSSAALDAGRWYDVGIHMDNVPASGSKILRMYVGDVEVAGSTTLNSVGGTAASLFLGGNLFTEANTAGNWFFDDVRINDDTGTAENGMPPVGGRVINLFPDAAGDVNTWQKSNGTAGSSTNYQACDENPPDDGTTLNRANTSGAQDLYNLESSGLGTDDTVNVVQVYDRHRNNVADATTAYALTIRKTSGGTEAQGAVLVPDTTTWRTGLGTSAVFPAPSLTAHTDPDGAAWTQSTVNSMQVGPKLTTTGTNFVQVSTVWAVVDSTAAPARRWYLANEAPDYTPATKRGAWDSSSATLARKLSYTPSGAAATAAVAETSTTDDFDVLVGRWISDPATVAGTLTGYANWVIGTAESDAAANMVWHAHLYVTAGDSDTPRGTLRADYVGSSEWPAAVATGRSAVNISLTSTAISVGDRIVLELGYRAQNTASTSYTGTIHYGNTGLADLRSTATTVTVDPGWVEIVGAQDIWDPDVEPSDTVEGEGTSAGTAATTGTATRVRNGTASATRTAATTATGAVVRHATGTATRTAASAATGVRVRNGAGASTATAASTAGGHVTRGASGAATSTAATAGTSDAVRHGAATTTTTAATTAAGRRIRHAAAASTATAATSGVGSVAGDPGIGQAAAAAATSGTARIAAHATGDATSAAATTGAAARTRHGDGTAAGTATTTSTATRARHAAANATTTAGSGGTANTGGASATASAAAATTATGRVVRRATAAAGATAATTTSATRSRHGDGLAAKVAATSGVATVRRSAAGTSTTTAATTGAAEVAGQTTSAVTAATVGAARIVRHAAGTAIRTAATTGQAARARHAAAAAVRVAGTAGVGDVVGSIIHQPVAGTIVRPSAGTIERPNIGLILQP